MTGCLPDRVLWLLSENDGSVEDRAHLAECTLCTRRARRLANELQLIGSVLADGPPRAVPRRVSLGGLALAAAILAAALVSLLAAPPVRRGIETAAGIAELDRFAADVLVDVDDDAADDADPVGAALAAASPCEWEPAGCRDVDQPLF